MVDPISKWVSFPKEYNHFVALIPYLIKESKLSNMEYMNMNVYSKYVSIHTHNTMNMYS